MGVWKERKNEIGTLLQLLLQLPLSLLRTSSNSATTTTTTTTSIDRFSADGVASSIYNVALNISRHNIKKSTRGKLDWECVEEHEKRRRRKKKEEEETKTVLDYTSIGCRTKIV